MPKIAITANYFSHDDLTITDSLREAGFTVSDLTGLNLNPSTPEDDVFEAVKGYDALLVGLERYTRPLLARLKACGLRMVSRCGIGYDSVDSDACRDLGITLARTTGAIEGAVAEHVMAYILYFAKRIDQQNREMHDRIWTIPNVPGAKTRTLGLVGFGGIGKEIALRARPFGMRILYNCRHPDPKWDAEYGVSYRSLPELLAESDYVSANVPLTPETRGMFGAGEFAAMKPGAVFINIARGPVASEEDLAAALKSGHLSGAAVDVFSHEPCTDSPLIECENAVLTPHSASRTIENGISSGRVACENCADWLLGRLPDRMRVV